MMRLKLLSSMLALALCTSSALAAHPVRYRLTHIADGFLTPADINRRGEVVGSLNLEAQVHGFYWHKGRFVDIHDQVSAVTDYVEATGNNDRSQICGTFIDLSVNSFRGFLLERDGGLRVIDGPPGADQVFLSRLNNREQILGFSFDLAGNESIFLWDRGTVSVFGPEFSPADFNNRGTFTGAANIVDQGTFAALWEDGEITLIGPQGSGGVSINDRGDVAGLLSAEDGAHAFVWKRGQLKILPMLHPDPLSFSINDINNARTIVGNTVILQGEETKSIATLWDDDGEVFDLNTLIDPDDPLRPFVTLGAAVLINDRGEIVASGSDLRDAGVTNYFLTPVRH